MKNEFFDPDTFPDEVVGFEEELTDVATGKSLGARKIEFPTRHLGYRGIIEFDLVEDIVTKKGFKDITVKATKQHPRRVRGMLIVLCGRHKEKKA